MSIQKSSIALILALCLTLPAFATEMARGIVYHDKNGNLSKDKGEEGLKDICVSNGVDVVKTNKEGEYELSITNDTILFVIKPRDWYVPLQAKTRLPQFYYNHKPEGSPKLKYRGVAPTGPLPESVNFPLKPRQENDQFRFISFGDPQPRNQTEMDYIAHDIVEELVDADAAFGVSLGDLVFDNLNVFDSYTKTLGLIGVPWYNVVGNHDINYDAPVSNQSDETFERYFGPGYYSYDYGKAHFLVLNNVMWDVDKREYHGEFGEDQIQFIQNDLKHVPKDKLIVVMMHIPLQDVLDRHKMLGLLEPFKHTFSMSAHWHRQDHYFMGAEDGWKGKTPHHHLVHFTVCGSWWGGAPDEQGIPHATMSDGGPNGYAFVSVDGNDYSMQYKAARREADYQMNVYAPEQVAPKDAWGTEIKVNAFFGSKDMRVEMKLGKDGHWVTMTRFTGSDPAIVARSKRQDDFIAMVAKERGIDNPDDNTKKKIWQQYSKVLGPGEIGPRDTDHLWKAPLPANPEPGHYVIYVRATDRWDQVHHGKRTIRIED